MTQPRDKVKPLKATFASLAVLATLGLADAAQAQPIRTSISGLLYTDFSAPTDGRAASFNVTRAFLTGRAQFDEIWSGTIIYNAYPQRFVSRVSEGIGEVATEPHDALLHNAYIQASGLLPNLTLQMGMLSNPWFEFQVGQWGYRMLGLQWLPMFNDGYIPSFDLGIKAVGNIGPLGYLAQVDNGSGFRSAENSAGKAYTAGVTVSPISGMTLAALGYRGDNPTLAQMDRYSLFAGYRTSSFRVGAEASRMITQPAGGKTVTGQILSAYTILGLPFGQKLSPELIVRADWLDRNVEAAAVAGEAEMLQGIVGLSIRPAPGVTLVLNDRISQETQGGSTVTQNTVALHTQVAF